MCPPVISAAITGFKAMTGFQKAMTVMTAASTASSVKGQHEAKKETKRRVSEAELAAISDFDASGKKGASVTGKSRQKPGRRSMYV